MLFLFCFKMNLCVWRILTLSSYSHFAQGHIPYLFSTYNPCAILELSGTIPELADRVRIPILRRTIPELYRFLLCAEHIYDVNNLVGDVEANPRDFYRYINCQKKSNQCIPLLKRRGGICVKDSEIEQAEEFTKEFNGQFTDMFNKNEHSEVPFLSRSAPFMDDIVVSKEGVTKLLKGLKSPKRAWNWIGFSFCPSFTRVKYPKNGIFRIENSVPRVTVWHHEVLPSDAKEWSRGTEFSIRTEHSYLIFFLAYISISKVAFITKQNDVDVGHFQIWRHCDVAVTST